MIIESELLAGVIYGDRAAGEYVYLPGSEVGAARPICIFEEAGERKDATMAEALRIIRLRSLRPVVHPVLGKSSF